MPSAVSTADPVPTPPAVESFLARWAAASASERANSQLFLSELCDLLAVPRPDPNHASGYAFEHPVTEHHPDGSTSQGGMGMVWDGTMVVHRWYAALDTPFRGGRFSSVVRVAPLVLRFRARRLMPRTASWVKRYQDDGFGESTRAQRLGLEPTVVSRMQQIAQRMVR